MKLLGMPIVEIRATFLYEKVCIEWVDPDDSWHNFKVVGVFEHSSYDKDVNPDMIYLWLEGIDEDFGEYNSHHDGVPFTVCIDEIQDIEIQCLEGINVV